MANVEKLSIAVTPEMAAMMREVVGSGEYASSSEVMREALREWKFRWRQREHAVEELKKLLDEGRNSGPLIDSEEVFDEIFAELDATHAELKSGSIRRPNRICSRLCVTSQLVAKSRRGAGRCQSATIAPSSERRRGLAFPSLSLGRMLG
jgi:antitoxin ParD1/3/4